MRTKPALSLAAALLVIGSAALAAPALASDPVLAQTEGTDDEGGDPTGAEQEAEGQEEQGGDGEGAGEAEAETGAGEGEQEGTAQEEGPVWTYQMSWMLLVLLFFLLLGIGGAYWNFVAKRQRQGI